MTKLQNIKAWATWRVRSILHRNNICWRNHDIDIEVVSPSKGRLRIFYDGKRSDYLEGEVLMDIDGPIPQMRWYDSGGMRENLVMPVEEVELEDA